MAYKGNTRFYRLPYMTQGDILTEAEEQRRATILDNLMYVATYGATKAIVEEATYTLTDASSENCTLTISSAGSGYVFLAIVNYRLAYKTDSIVLNLERGRKYYVYLIDLDGIDINPERCSVLALTNQYTDISHLLLCTVDYTGDEAVLDTDTDKQYLTNLAAHSMDSTNPHGTTLHQDTLNVNAELNLQGEPIYTTVYREILSTGTTPKVVQVEDFSPVFVTAVPESLDAGNVAAKVNSDGTIQITNSGSTGIKIQLRIEGSYTS